MARKFPNWLKAYQGYANDNYCPDQFHLWSGLSVLAGALERKVWISQGGLVTHYPNLYVLCVSHPGVGKSTAIDRGVELLEMLREIEDPNFKIIPNQITEPGLLDAMKLRQEMLFGTKIVFHSSGYFYASEASASALQNLFGDFNATVTAFYDCPRVFRKKIKSEPEATELPNVCFNLIAGATFDYLKNLVNEQSVMGGFASRMIYVICKDRIVRQPKWGESFEADFKMRDALFADLCEIHKLQGRFTVTKEFISAWEAWQPEFDKFLIGLQSPRLESLYARKATNLMKICMLLSVSENNDLILTHKHWEQGAEMIEEVSKDNAFIVSSAAIADTGSQTGITQTIGRVLQRNGGTVPMRVLRTLAMSSGNDVDRINKTIDYMLASNWLSIDADQTVKLLVDPDRYL